jgi:hypothetical protein
VIQDKEWRRWEERIRKKKIGAGNENKKNGEMWKRRESRNMKKVVGERREKKEIWERREAKEKDVRDDPETKMKRY